MLDQTSQQPLSIIFTLRTYTHATRQNQDEAAQTMGEISWASHVSRKRTQKYRREGKTSSPVLFKPIRTFPRVGHGVGQCLTHILTHTVFSVFTTKKHRKPKFSVLFGAAGQIRTADLILTNHHRAFQPLLYKALRHFLSKKDEVAACLFHCFRPLISPCGSRCGSKRFQDANEGRTSDSGKPSLCALSRS